MGDDGMLDRLAIRELVDNWSLYRDNRDWERFFTVWHEGGAMMTTWGGKPARTSSPRRPRRASSAATGCCTL